MKKEIQNYASNMNHRSIAIFIDFENLALGYKGQGRFEIQLVLKRLLEKGKIVAKKAYCDWSRFGNYASSLHEAAIELIEIPKRAQTGKNSADIRLCVDAMDLAYSKDHIDTFVIVSGDSDFSPLVSKLKELGKHVIGLGMSASTSTLLRDNCDEFIYYEDLTPSSVTTTPTIKGDVAENKRKAFNYLFEGLQALRREDREVLRSSLVKDTIKRMHPSFNENHLGFKNWGSLLVDAQREGLLELTTDPRSGTFVIVRFGDEMKAETKAETKTESKVEAKTTLPAPVTPTVQLEAQAISTSEVPVIEVPQTSKPKAEPRRRPTGRKPAAKKPSQPE